MVRIWCVPVSELDRQRLLGEHVELHSIVGALLDKYKAYKNHPLTLRYKDHIEQFYYRHGDQLARVQTLFAVSKKHTTLHIHRRRVSV
jgi:hypothetical protein